MIRILLLFSLVFLSIKADFTNNEYEKYRSYESFVELKGGDFLMGSDDRDGVNHEYPQRKASVKPFRYIYYKLSLFKMLLSN